jgi:hypothetical protein
VGWGQQIPVMYFWQEGISHQDIIDKVVVRDAEDGPELFKTSRTTIRGELKENIYH